ncbi:MAG: methyltransferase domain-containing protein [Desulfobacterales bacterium]|nr:methyltransferase domain-containing protein [Desulfobacterales bacterium]
MTDLNGSYSYGAFDSNEDELKRLERQAAIEWQREKEVLLAAGLRPGMKVLDLACGPGFITDRIGGLVQPGGSVLGGDINDRLLDIAQQRHKGRGDKSVIFRKENCYELSLGDAVMDFVYARFLFQHLENPLEALKEARRVLKPGGVCTVLDVDDSIFSVLPEPAGLRDFRKQSEAYQKTLGGDRKIGRALGYYFREAGFEAVDISVAVVTSEQIGMRPFLDISTGFKIELTPPEDRERVKSVLKNIYDEAEKNGAFALVGVFIVTGKRKML